MDLRRKLELATQAIVSISQHDDVDLFVREAVLTELSNRIEDEKALAKARALSLAQSAMSKADD